MTTQDNTLLYTLGAVYLTLVDAMSKATGKRVDLMANEILRSTLEQDDDSTIPPEARDLLWCLLNDEDELRAKVAAILQPD